MNFKIIGTGMYVPDNIVENSDLEKFVDTTDEWIQQRIGVCRRHISVNETASDMGYQAALRALESSGTAVSDLDLILAATVSCENVSPSLACKVQNLLGATCLAFDINAACASFVFLLETVAGFFARGTVKKALIIGGEQLSRIVDWTDRSTCVIFGDGAGAVVLEQGDNFLDSTLTSVGGENIILIPHYQGESPFWKRESEKPFIHMRGQETFKFAVNAVCSDLKLLLDRNGLTMDDIKYIVPHQANKRIIDYAAVMMNAPQDKFYLNIENYGNTSSASIPIALDEMNRSGMLQKDDLLLFVAFGGGLAHAACLLRW
jgi:3-oxoacyl-[acyl-carrier-protein] synthase-3